VSTPNLLQNEHSLRIQITNVSRILDGLEKQLGAINAEMDSHANERSQFQLLSTIVTSLDKLEAAGAAELFWDSKTTGYSPANQLQRARNAIVAYEKKIGLIEAKREGVQKTIKLETVNLRRLNEELLEIEDEAESLRQELAIVRQAVALPFRPLVMPWSRNGEDDRRYRRIFLFTVLFSFVFSSGVLWFKPTHVKKREEIVPEHIAELVVRKKEEPKPVEKKDPAKSDAKGRTKNQPAGPQTPNATRDPELASPPPGTPSEPPSARAAAESKGVLALKKDFAGLLDSTEPVKMGAEGRISDTGQIAPGTAAQRSLILSQSGGAASGGINTSAISRAGTGGGTGGGGIGTGGGGQSITGGGVKVARVQSTAGGGGGEDRPLSGGAGPSRTDEEIQIVFDRYKAALYRIYNRELRNDPSLRGKMVLTLTIQPDGRVSSCVVKSTDLASATLSAEVVDRVLRFTFGAKEGVPPITINYPIDFLPAG
jgi:hypothetical protein